MRPSCQMGLQHTRPRARLWDVTLPRPWCVASVYRRLIDWCATSLKPGGSFAFELHETCLDDAAAEAEYAGFADVRIVQDLVGRPRVLTGRKRL